MKFLHANPPQFSADVIADIAWQHYGLRGKLKNLYSERDQNFYLKQEDGTGFMLKIANQVEDPAIIDCQIKLFDHLAIIDPGLPVPRVIRTKDGQDSIHLKSLEKDAEKKSGNKYIFYVLSYLEGELAHNVPLTAPIAYDIGKMLARLGLAMRGFFHPATGGRDLLWDMRIVRQYIPFLAELPVIKIGDTTLADLAKKQIEDFSTRVLPNLSSLRAQVIHGDVHEHNLILHPTSHAITGVIDFGDVIHAPLIFDIADSVCDFLNQPQRIDTMMRPLVAGYAKLIKLEEPEVAVIYDIALMRMVTALVVNVWRAARTPDEENYLHAATDGTIQVVEMLQTMGRDRATDIFRMAAGVPAQKFFKLSDNTPSGYSADKTPNKIDDKSTATANPAGAKTPADVATLIARRKKFMGSHLYVFYDPPLNIVKGEGVWLYDAHGRRYMDCYNNVPIVGHAHSYVVEAINRQARTLNTNTRYLGEEILDYAERLSKKTGGELNTFAFVNSGSEANDIAWRMALAWADLKPGHGGAVCQEFAYHGITWAIDAVSPSANKISQAAHLARYPHVRTIVAPDAYRGQYGNDGAKYAGDVDNAIASLAQENMKPAAYFLDSTFITNGILEPMAGYVAEVFKKIRAAGGLCIGDEVQSGFGRMGKNFWGYQHHGVMPDIVTIGKPAGNGHPLGIVITRPEIYEKFIKSTAFFSTFGGNNVSCAAGLAVLDVIEQNNLVDNASLVGDYLKTGFKKLMAQHDAIGDVRGIGLALGIEIVADRKTKKPDKPTTDKLINKLRDEGVLVASEGEHGSVIKMRPPLIFTQHDADFALAAF
ncbi:MAG: aminotransferase class III-fold pyridoxal phosphate-dependent enzyme, partial [Hydrotalea sp.]|nr:aminotransferase class III-fold pyridoxal phosphate-dependent enzyme [Hydrotalea sp.]